ncbi:MAG: GTPase ObgE [Dehalococcoidales bacterium]|nr:GTPase ObgE [Dehalococcoidales bacterium]
MFDKVELTAIAGKGGDGTVGWRREKFVPLGGPDGGDGGNGGNVIIKADNSISDFRFFRNRGIYRAEAGKRGGNKKMHGRSGEDLVILVPPGTVVLPKTQVGSEQDIIADLEQDKDEVIIARGGKGGFGNTHYKNPVRQSPQIAQKGEPGEEISVVLDLRLIADIGIIGYPNVGKSSLLAAASAANPKIADYAFTTREPILGVVDTGKDIFVLAEIPGLIVGAAFGKGLGHDFLHHALRTKIFIHLIDGLSKSPVDDMIAVNNELTLFDSKLGQKPQLVVVNKVDVREVQTRMQEIRDSFTEAGVDIRFISAATGEGVKELMQEAYDRLEAFIAAEVKPDEPKKVFRPQPKDTGLKVKKEDDIFVIELPNLARMVSDTGENTYQLVHHVQAQLKRLGLNHAMAKAGAKPGDKVRCGSVEWDWYPS